MLKSLALMALWAPSLTISASLPLRSVPIPSLSLSEISNGSFPRYYNAEFLERSPPPGSSPGSGLCNSAYLGCFADNVDARALNAAFGVHDSMTGEMCIGFCAGLGYMVAGTGESFPLQEAQHWDMAPDTSLEWSTQCFCGRSIRTLVSRPDSECSMPCAGNSTQACGGPIRLSVYADLPDAPITNPGDGKTFEYAGCWTDRVSDRTLLALVLASGNPDVGPTVKTCVATCRALGFAFAGVEYAGGMFFRSLYTTLYSDRMEC
jgi:hypothetical protein